MTALSKISVGDNFEFGFAITPIVVKSSLPPTAKQPLLCKIEFKLTDIFLFNPVDIKLDVKQSN